jgi:hypothetical protein
MRRLVSVGLAAALVLSLAGTTLAAKGGNGKGGGATGSGPALSSIVLNQVGQPLAFGDSVTFTTVAAGLTGNQYPLVYLQCLQGSTVVYGQLDVPTATFVLGGASSPWWSSPGPATCQATLYAYGGNPYIVWLVATPTFDVAG